MEYEWSHLLPFSFRNSYFTIFSSCIVIIHFVHQPNNFKPNSTSLIIYMPLYILSFWMNVWLVKAGLLLHDHSLEFVFSLCQIFHFCTSELSFHNIYPFERLNRNWVWLTPHTGKILPLRFDRDDKIITSIGFFNATIWEIK